MTVTVGEILKMPQFRGFKLLAGASGLNREVLRTTVGDAPDCWRWSQGGELVITSGYAFQRVEDQESLIQDSFNHGNAAVGIKFGRYIESLTPHVLELADKLGFPVISIPVEFAFADILHPVQSRVIQDQAHLLRYSDTVRSTFFELSLQCAGLNELLETLRNFTHVNLALKTLSNEFDCICSEDAAFESKVKDAPLAETLRAYPHEAVSLNERVQAYLIFDSSLEELRRPWNAIPIAQAKGALLLFFQRWSAQTQAERRYRSEFVQDILTNNLRLQEEVWSRARAFGWNLTGPQMVIVCDIDNYKDSMTRSMAGGAGLSAMENLKARIFAMIGRSMRELNTEAPFAELSDSAAFILPSPAPGKEKKRLEPVLRPMMEAIVRETGFTVTVGIGERCADVFSCWKSYDQARKGLELIRGRRGGGQIAWWHEMGASRVLDRIVCDDAVREFVKEQLGAVLAWDRKQKGELFKTLQAMVAHNWSKKECAAALALHYNTLKYRWNRICELADCDFASSESRFALTLALEIYKMDNGKAKELS